MSPSIVTADLDGSVEVKDNNGQGGSASFNLNPKASGSKTS